MVDVTNGRKGTKMARTVCAGLIVERDGPVIAEKVRVAIRATRLCHSDLTASRDAPLFPVVLGHEAAGVVGAVGPGGIGTRHGGNLLQGALRALTGSDLGVLAPGGILMVLGAASREALRSLALPRFMARQQTIRGDSLGACRPPARYPLFARWALDGRLRVAR